MIASDRALLINMQWQRWTLCAILLSPITCDSLDNFIITETATAQIPRGTILDQLTQDFGFGELNNLDISANQELANQGVQRHQIDSVRILTLTLEITAPPNQDFGFLNSVTFFVESPGFPKVEIARGENFAAGATKVDLTIADVNLADYAAAESMTITTEANGRRPENDTTLEAVMMLDVDVNLEGAACGG